MKALSIREPWASLIASGTKTIETRTWKTDYRGRLLLCCGKKIDVPATLNANINPRLQGKAFAVADLVDVVKMPLHRGDPLADSIWKAAVCDVYPCYGWILSNVTLIEPFSVKGRLGLFDVAYPNPTVKTQDDVVSEGIKALGFGVRL